MNNKKGTEHSKSLPKMALQSRISEKGRYVTHSSSAMYFDLQGVGVCKMLLFILLEQFLDPRSDLL